MICELSSLVAQHELKYSEERYAKTCVKLEEQKYAMRRDAMSPHGWLSRSVAVEWQQKYEDELEVELELEEER